MFTKPKHGWVRIELGNFFDKASYVTDIPNDCLDAFIYALKNNMPATVHFDAEGWDYYLVSTNYLSYVIREKDSSELFVVNKNNEEIAKEMIRDFSKYIEEWADWECFDDIEEVGLEGEINNLNKKISELKNILKAGDKNK